MKTLLKRLIGRYAARHLAPVTSQMEQQTSMLVTLAEENFRLRAQLAARDNRPIRVLLVCHLPSLWSSFESLYRALQKDETFTVEIVALPYRHSTLPAGQYKDDGVLEFFASRGITVIQGYNSDTRTWRTPESFSADYVFFQTPYDLFPTAWSVYEVAMRARVCYIPYGTCLCRELDEIVRPEVFLRYVSIGFMESPLARELLVRKFESKSWFNSNRLIVSGHPKLDFLVGRTTLHGGVWRRKLSPSVTRILWTPRWNSWEGTCHFFDHKDVLLKFCRDHDDVDFAFRPHPLCFDNFLKTGEMTANDIRELEENYASSPNMALDRTPDYRDTFLTADILVSDVSSMMLEFFASGKPIIYTHRVDTFNELGHVLAKGCYWARSQDELRRLLEMLLAGEDPMKGQRQELLRSLLYFPEGGAGYRIKDLLLEDFGRNASQGSIDLDPPIRSQNHFKSA